MTANVHVVMFDTLYGAEAMLENVNTWQDNGWITVEDAVVVTRGTGSTTPPLAAASAATEQPRIITSATEGTQVEIKQTQKQTGKFTLGGGGIGLLAGLLLGGPIGGLVAGATIGAITGALQDKGVDDGFIREMSEGLQPGHSALVLMTSAADEERILAELKPHKATLVKTTLAPERERALREALSKGS